MAILAGQRIRALDWAGYANGIDGTNVAGFQTAAGAWAVPSPVFGVSFMAPTSGAVKCEFGGRIRIVNGINTVYAACSLRTGAVINSGSLVEDVSVEQAIEIGAYTGVPAARLGGSMFRIHTGLTPGALYHFVWQMGQTARVAGTGTTDLIDVLARTIAVSPWQG